MPEDNIKTIIIITEPEQPQSINTRSDLHRYRLSDLEPERLHAAVVAISGGNVWIDAHLKNLLDSAASKSTFTAPDPDHLTPADQQPVQPAQPAIGDLKSMLSQRDIQVLKMIAAGATNLEIAQQLFLSVSTVKTVIHRLLDAFQVSDRTQAAVFATRHGII